MDSIKNNYLMNNQPFEIRLHNKIIFTGNREILCDWDRYFSWFYQSLFRQVLVENPRLYKNPFTYQRKTFRKLSTRFYLLFRYLELPHKRSYDDKDLYKLYFFRIIHLETLGYLACLQYLYYFNDFVYFHKFKKDGKPSVFIDKYKHEIPQVISSIFKELGLYPFPWYKQFLFYFLRSYCLVLKTYYYLCSKIPLVLTEKYITLELIPSVISKWAVKIPFLSSRIYGSGKNKTWFSSLMKSLVFFCVWLKGTLKLAPILVFFYYSGSSMVAGYLLSFYFFYKMCSWMGLWFIMLFQATHLPHLKSALVHSVKLPYKLALGFTWLMVTYYVLFTYASNYTFLTLGVVFTLRFILNAVLKERKGKLTNLLKTII